ncbi:hypothetical protein [Photobacterium frigidiphilum]|nr:hypothetical protein [Photobacterium frigidiphilum]
MQKLLHQWCFDCQLEQFGKKPTNGSFRGQMVFIDQEAPEEGERINLILG